MLSRFVKFVVSEKGATAAEYAIMSSLIMVAIVAAVVYLGVNVSALFQSFITAMKW